MRNFPKIALTAGIVALLSLSMILLSSWKSPQLKKGKADDTTKTSAGKKKSKYSRTTIITFDEDGKPHEKIMEDFEGDEGLKDLMKSDAWFNLNFPPVPPIPNVPSLPNIPALPNIPNWPNDIAFPPMPPMPAMPPMDIEGFEQLGEEYEALMENHLKDLGPEFEASMELMQEQLGKMDFEFSRQFDGWNEEMQKELERVHETTHRDFRIDLDRMNEELEILHESWTKDIKEFEKEAREELIKDGYLKESEKIESMSWTDDEIKFNDKVIKSEHVDKYRTMQKKYTKRNRYIGRPE